jgi:phenylpropionate dioxygenase-like ring-hydroxylating dioxygenase large terminal subunit
VAAGFSHQVKDKPIGVDILGMRVVLFRDSEGKVQCMQDACPHRWAPALSCYHYNAPPPLH